MNSLLSSNNNTRDNYFQKIMQRDPSSLGSGQHRILFAGTILFLFVHVMFIVYVLEPPLTTERGQVSSADDQYNILSV